MKYTKPSIELHEAQAAEILAESLIISNVHVDGDNALTRENNSWDIWETE
ncbi:MAG: hypothetical protein J6Y59_08280 [Bacteroidaceae bacterium]|nr:hypothetical protein [Bacteroidaceae bacterium]